VLTKEEVIQRTNHLVGKWSWFIRLMLRNNLKIFCTF
jgi:hypothetical protein